MSSTLQNLVPLLDGANTYLAWELAMQSYLEAQGLWRYMLRGPPSAISADVKGDKLKSYEDKLDKFEEADSKAKGSIKLCLHQTIASQIKAEKTAKEIWDKLADTYGKPGPSMAYVELKKAINVLIPENADPTPAVNTMMTHFTWLKEMKFEVPANIQCLILLARLPSSMDYIVQKSNAIKAEDWDKLIMEELRAWTLLHWEQHSGKKPQQQQKAQKITAVKQGSNDAPSFSEQKGDSQKKTRRSKMKKPTAQNAEEQEDLASGKAEQGYAQIASPIFLPCPTALRRPTPGPSSSIYPLLNEALKVARALEVWPTTETLKRLENLERTQVPRPRKRCSLEQRISREDQAPITWTSEEEEIAAAAGLSGPSTKYVANCIPRTKTDIALALNKNINRNLSRCSTPIRDDALLECSLELLVLGFNKLVCPSETDKKVNEWMLDSGASMHFTNDMNDFVEYQPIPPISVKIAINSVSVKGKGTIILGTEKGEFVRIYPVYYLEGLSNRLLSLGTFLQNGLYLRGSSHSISLYDNRNEKFLSFCPRAVGDTIFTMKTPTIEFSAHMIANVYSLDYETLHRRLVHPSREVLRRAGKHVKDFPLVEFPKKTAICPGCEEGKMTNKPFPPSESRAEKLFELICHELKSCSPRFAPYVLRFAT